MRCKNVSLLKMSAGAFKTCNQNMFGCYL